MKRKLQIIILLLFVTFIAACDINSDTNNGINTIEVESVSNDTNEEGETKQERSLDERKGSTNNSVESSDKITSQENEIIGQSNKQFSEMKVHFIDVGQADAALIQYDDRSILIDSGDWNGNETVNYLNELGVKKLDLIVGSHPHADHIGQIDKIINEIEVDEVWMSGGTTTSQVFQRVLTAIEQRDIGYDEPRTGDTFQIGNLKIDVLSPTSITGNLNDDSIVMKLSYGNISFLFTGDAETPAENKMVSSGQNLSSTILKVGHHGSNTSSTPAFVDKVDPKVAIISVAAKSKYNHPNKSVIDRFNKRGTDLYATKTHGTIVVSTDGISYDVSTNKSGKVVAGNAGKSKKKKVSTNSQKSSSTSKKPQKESKTKGSSNNHCIDINSASEAELQSIKHIGEARAPMVIELRPFNSVDELVKVKGIAKGRLADIKEEGKACVK